MRTEFDLVMLLLSAVLFALVAGAYTAMQLIFYVRYEHNGDDEEENRSTDHFGKDPVHNYFSLGLGRLAALGLVLWTAARFASAHVDPGAGLAFFGFVAVAALTPYVLGNLVGLRFPEEFSSLARYVVYPLIYVFWPLSVACVALLRRMSPRLASAVSFPVLPFKRRLELFGFKNGDEDSDGQALMESVFEFVDTRVKEVMVPRIDMVAVNIHMSVAEATDIIVDAGHSRVPVFDETIDKIVGVIHTKDMLKKMVTGADFSLKEIRRDVYFVPESKKIDELLSEFKQRKMHLAIAVDEYGGTAGLITLEDILEELVGDIQDEFDSEEEFIERVDDDTVVCSSRVPIDDLNHEFGLDLPEESADTLGGFLYVTIGRVPRPGDSVTRGGVEFKVQSVVRQRIGKVMITGLKMAGRKIEDGLG